MQREAAQSARQRLVPTLQGLDDLQHFLVTSSYGIGTMPLETPVQAALLLKTIPQVLRLRTEAERRLRLALVD
jgi:hypothetical protein